MKSMLHLHCPPLIGTSATCNIRNRYKPSQRGWRESARCFGEKGAPMIPTPKITCQQRRYAERHGGSRGAPLPAGEQPRVIYTHRYESPYRGPRHKPQIKQAHIHDSHGCCICTFCLRPVCAGCKRHHLKSHDRDGWECPLCGYFEVLHETSPSERLPLPGILPTAPTACANQLRAGNQGIGRVPAAPNPWAGNGGRRTGAGRKPLPVSELKRPDLKDRRALKGERPKG